MKCMQKKRRRIDHQIEWKKQLQKASKGQFLILSDVTHQVISSD